MNKKKASLKEEALLAITRGEWKKALGLFQKHCAQVPDDLRSLLRVAEILERLGKKKEAIKGYRQVAEAYARDGFLLQAISVNKMILRIDPSAKEANDHLAKLYLQKTQEATRYHPLPPIPLFSDLDEQELHGLLDRIQTRTFSKGQFICQEDDRGDSLMIICRGEVAITKRDPEGKEVWIRNLTEGDCFGEFGFFLDQRRHANVRAETECEILEIFRNNLDEIIRIYPHVREVLEDLFKKRILDLLLALSPLFSSLTLTEREEVLKRFRPRQAPSEALLFKGGDPSHCLYMIKSGEVEIFTQDRHGKRVRLGRLGSGSFFGEIGVLMSAPRMAFAKTTLPSELLELTKEDFDTILHQFPKLRSTVKEISSKRLVRMKEILSREIAEKAKEWMV